MDHIYIENLKIFAHHGVYEREKTEGQDFYVSAKLYFDTSHLLTSDNLEETVNYGEICDFIREIFTFENNDLIETAGQRLAVEILKKYERIEKIEIIVSKPHAPLNIHFENVSSIVTRSRHTAYLGLGSNMGYREHHLNNALRAFSSSDMISILKVSDFIETKPVGYQEQPDFLNGAAAIRTLYNPYELLDFINSIEASEKRERSIHWGPRTLDIDILLYDDMILSGSKLSIPHIRMHERRFVLEPLCQIAPGAVHPIMRKSIYMMLSELMKR